MTYMRRSSGPCRISRPGRYAACTCWSLCSWSGDRGRCPWSGCMVWAAGNEPPASGPPDWRTAPAPRSDRLFWSCRSVLVAQLPAHASWRLRVRVAPDVCAWRDASLSPETWSGCAQTGLSGILRRDRLAGHRIDECRSSPPHGASLAMSKSGRSEDRFWWFYTSGSSRDFFLNRMPFPRFSGEFGSGSSVGVQSPGCGF